MAALRRRPDQKPSGQRRLQPLLRQLLQLAGLLRLGDDLVDLGQQRRLVLVQADVAGRVLDHELQHRRARRALLGDRGGDRVAGGDQVDLAGDEGGDGGVVVLVALDRGRGRRALGQLLLLDRAARGADGLAGEILVLGRRDRLGAVDAGEERRVGDREVDHLLALGVLAEAGDDEVGLLGLQVGDAVGAGDGDDLGLHAELLGDQVGHVDVVALRLQVRSRPSRTARNPAARPP